MLQRVPNGGVRGRPASPRPLPALTSRGKHVTRAKSWWKRGDVSACAAHSNMECWVHHNTILDYDQATQRLKDAWEHDDSKDELNIDLQGLERHFWLGKEAGRLGCYNFPGETWAGDGSAHKRVMGAGSVCLQQQSKYLEIRVGREEEGINSLRPKLAAMARTLQATTPGVDLLHLCDSETALQKVSWLVGSGPRTTLTGDANADIMTTVVECVRERVMRGARTFMVKVKAHRGEPLNVRADFHAENARQLQRTSV